MMEENLVDLVLDIFGAEIISVTDRSFCKHCKKEHEYNPVALFCSCDLAVVEARMVALG